LILWGYCPPLTTPSFPPGLVLYPLSFFLFHSRHVLPPTLSIFFNFYHFCVIPALSRVLLRWNADEKFGVMSRGFGMFGDLQELQLGSRRDIAPYVRKAGISIILYCAIAVTAEPIHHTSLWYWFKRFSPEIQQQTSRPLSPH
jgi:hypothetical protein